MVKSLVSKLSAASSTLSIASSFGSSHSKHHDNTHNGNAVTSTAISGDNYLKYRNDPGRFFGDGVQFKAKLIGILEVGEARGDRMCQEALQDLKMAIRAAGEHKQRITIHVTIDGLRLRDEKTGDSLYHHPVHKISFIAQDMTDSRAFGYIFGSPDSGHRFFGIKTDKAASQVVLAMRDLFQVVFELKKKEIELARQQIQSKSIHHHDQHQLASLSSLKSAAAGAGGQNDLSGLGGVGGGSSTSAATLSMLNTMVSSSTNTPAACRLGFNMDSKGASKEISPESVADLVDLEQELNSLQRGINQMERITPNDGNTSKSSLGGSGVNDDPFGDSFTNFPTLPPPEPGRLRSKASTKSIDLPTSTNAATSALLSPSATHGTQSPIPTVGLSASAPPIQPLDDDDNWLRELDAHNDVFDTSKAMMPGLMGMPPLASSLTNSIPLGTRAPLATRESTETPPSHIYETVSCSATAAMSETNEISNLGNSAATAVGTTTAAAATNAEANSLANSSSLTDIFQTSTGSAEASKVEIKSDAFTDLDPLGTGRIRPYVDKKFFFQELKNPPKKVLKDLTAANHQHSNLIASTTLTTTSAAAASAAAAAAAATATATKTTTAITSIATTNMSLANTINDHGNMLSASSFINEDILNLQDLNGKSNPSSFMTSQINSSSIINSLLTTSSSASSATKLTPATASSFMATGINATTIYSPHASLTTSTIRNSTLAATSATVNYSQCSSRSGNNISNFNNSNNNSNNNSYNNSLKKSQNNNTALICTYPTSIIVTCTITNASSNRFTNQIPLGKNNHNNNNNLLTQSLTSSSSSNAGGGSGGLATVLTGGGGDGGSTNPIQNTTSHVLTQQTNSLRFSRYPPTLESLDVPCAAGDAVMLPRDTDPFSPTRKKSDPFEEGGDLFSKLDPFEFEFNNAEREEDKAKVSKVPLPPKDTAAAVGSQDIMATGHLQVSLPPEADPAQPVSTVRSRPTPSAAMTGIPLSSGPLPPASLLKQQTVDVISSISNKKMPHLFGQSSRFPKRDSNSINMRRLQESDSLSETEAAPEPPPRPDSATYIEPPPLPPKKQFNDIVIRPRMGASPVASTNRYESVTTALATKLGATSRTSPVSGGGVVDVPPIPLPSRRVGRTDGSYPGPGRPRKPGHTEDDYLAPLGALNASSVGVAHSPDVPPLLPPPTQSLSRARQQHRQQSFSQGKKPSHDIYENKQEILQQQLQQQQQQQHQQQQQQQHKLTTEPTIVPDITLSQLLTLGIDELSLKLNVPTSKLSTMTLVELTSYLAAFLEQSKPDTKPSKTPQTQEQHSVFKVNFDQEATFVAKFDDTFGEDFSQLPQTSASSFEANFAQFDSVNVEPPVQSNTKNSHVPPADRYAVFREIIDQELQQQQQEIDLIGDVMEDDECLARDEKQFDSFPMTTDLDMNAGTRQPDLLSGDMPEVSGPQPSTIDTKISEVLAQAKDRYAALRDLILVENLFDQPPAHPAPRLEESDIMRPDSKSPFQGFSGFNDDDEDQDLKQLMDQDISLDPTAQQQRLGLVDSRGFLVEPSSSAITVEDDEEDDEQHQRHRREDKEDQGGLSSADSNEKEQDKDNLPIVTYEQLASSNQQLEDIEEKREKMEDTPRISITQSLTNTENNYLSVGSVASSGLSGSKDDLEIDDLMQRAISNLSLDSRERSSPAVAAAHLLTTTGGHQQTTNTATTTMTPQHFNDVSTSPISLQRSPAPSITTQAKSPSSSKSPQQISPLPTQLTVLSQIIDNATRQIQHDTVSKTSNESWATFDTPQHQPAVASDKRARPAAKPLSKSGNFLNLPPPPGSTSNCSQNDSALESPCSSDPRDEAWHKHAMGGSSLSLGHNSAVGSSAGAQRRYHKKERQNTSSSSRDLSWDEDQGVVGSTHIIDYPPSSKRMPAQIPGNLTSERSGYYRRHGRRMNSCDEDYDYEQDMSAVRGRDPCKHKRNLSRSRDNFEMDSPGWYHHHGAPYPHHTWSSQDIEQVRGRSFDRSAYERTTYGPPIYDKRGVGPPMPPPQSAYDRRSTAGSYDKRGKYYRGDPSARSSNVERMYTLDDFDEMLAATGKIPPHLAGMYEEMKTECCSPQMVGAHRQRIADYMYDRERKSFDRESLESYEGSNMPPRRRRRSYDSGGDPYGSCDSRDDYHRDHRVMTADKSRSLRKSLKSLRVSGDIDYDQDSEKEYHYRDQRTRCDTRSLQRPSQLSTQPVGGNNTSIAPITTMGSQSRIRKSSGSSPWDGEEPPMPGQKPSNSSWKRPSSAADADRRLAENRRATVKGQTPSGSEDDKDRRYRKKRGSRNKDMTTVVSGGRYREPLGMRTGGNYDYITCGDLDDDAEDYVDEEEEEEDPAMEEDETSPADEDKFARLEMRRHEMHNRMMDAHVRRRKDGAPPTSTQMSSMASYRKSAPAPYGRKPLPPNEAKHLPQDYGYDDDGEYEQTPTPRSNTSSALPTATPNTSTKFSFDVGFESDFNQSSPPPAPAGTASSCNSTPAANVSASNTPASKSSFRFSNDFSLGSEREKHYQHPAGSLQQYELENRGISPQAPPTTTHNTTPKLRFDDNVKVSQFDDAFEDDFSQARFEAFEENKDQWQESLQRTTKQQIRNNKMQQRQQDLIKKSESINIFAKKVEDPFEDDDFFNTPSSPVKGEKTENQNSSSNGNATTFHPQQQHWDDNNTNFAKFDEHM